MKTIKKFLAVIVDGEVKKKEEVTEKATRLSKAVPVEKVVMDTTALSLTNKAKAELAQAKAKKSNIDLVIWEEIENKADNSGDKNEIAKAKAKEEADKKAKAQKEADKKAKAKADAEAKAKAKAKAEAESKAQPKDAPAADNKKVAE